MKKLLLVLFACTIFSCAPVKLTKEELAFNPYRKGDKLVYKDSKNTFDTIVITSVKKGPATKGGLYLLPHYHILRVGGILTSKKHELNNPFRGKYEVSIMSLSKDIENTHLVVNLTVKDDTIGYLNESFKLIHADAITFVLEPVRHNNVKEIHYHKRYGFTQYNYADGTTTELVAFIRDKNNIYNAVEDEFNLSIGAN